MPQSLARLHVHLVFSTKNRVPVLRRPLRDSLHRYMATVLQNFVLSARPHQFGRRSRLGLERPFRAL